MDLIIFSIWFGKKIPFNYLTCIEHNNCFSKQYGYKFELISDDAEINDIEIRHVPEELKELDIWKELSPNNKSDLARIFLASTYTYCLYTDCDNVIIKLPELNDCPLFGKESFADIHFFFNGGAPQLFHEIYEAMLDYRKYGFFWCLTNTRRVYRRKNMVMQNINSDCFKHDRITTTRVFGRKIS